MVEMTRILVWLTCFFWEQQRRKREASQLHHPGFKRQRHRKDGLCQWLFTFRQSWELWETLMKAVGPLLEKRTRRSFQVL